ncbi:DUF2735 domain-containing protein [Lichenifustis flavocetrariae]|uniref:DUF2735 domain-containing protein n=1 Tax=Lichenifustis flavocetrariae TaxID=2949735 RepID=A0AA42CJ55_9HYPH|nr:DUF2735 domain-containing protein [Lichenifustis flavocetrariae]MCW6507636.1 DUF2735 domain-containing protein [Lichenifustis flavocetrariae]
MTTTVRRESAKIYVFPRKPRTALNEPFRQSESAGCDFQRTAYADFGSWYHEAAVQEAERSRKS